MTVLLKLLRFVTEHQRWWQLNYNWAPQQVYTLDLFLINYLSISLSPAVSLTHRAKSRGNAPVHQAEEKEQFSGSLWVIFKQSAPAVCTCFLLHKQTPDWLWHTHTHTLLSDFLPFVHVSLLRWTSRIVLLCWGFHRTGSSLRTLRIHRTQINCPEMFRKRATASQPAWNPQPGSLTPQPCHGISGTTTESSGRWTLDPALPARAGPALHRRSKLSRGPGQTCAVGPQFPWF